MSTAAFIRTDSTTEGNWVGNYGADGYNLMDSAAGGPVTPAYATITLGGSPFTSGFGSDVRFLEFANLSNRVDAVRFSASAFVALDLDISGGGTHQLACYFYDTGNGNRQQTVEIIDVANANAVLDTQSLTAFFAPSLYLVWNVSGHIGVRITKTVSFNGVLNGFFLDTPLIVSSVQPIMQVIS